MKITVWLKHSEVSCWHFSEEQKSYLQNLLPEHNIVRTEEVSEFLEELQDTDIAIVWVFKQEWFEHAPKLKHIVSPAAGKDYFSVDPPRDIKIWNSGFHGEIMSESAVGYILSHARGLQLFRENKKDHSWNKAIYDKHIKRVKDSTITIVGFGRIAQTTAKKLKSLEPRIIGVRRSKAEKPDFLSEHDKMVTTDELKYILPETDHLLLVMPRNNDSDRMINKEIFDHLPEHAAVYNIGRGNAINETDLYEALKSKSIAAAYLDVFEEEPLSKDSPLWDLDNCFIYPHVSAVDPEYLNRFADEFAERFDRDFV